MAGIGEASAILAVAQIGFVLSNTLIAYIGEVKGAHSRINSIGNEIQTTSERLKEIGELVEKNKQNPILSQASITSAIRCSSECRDIIDDVKKILCKSELSQKSGAPEKDEIDISLFSRLTWPILKRKLEIPRVELQRIKIDLLLIFSAAMAFTASTTVEQEIYKQSLPKLKRTRSWAAKRSEKAKRRAQGRYLDPGGRGPYTSGEEEKKEEDDDDSYGDYGCNNHDMITIQSMIDSSTDRKKGQSEEDPRMPREKRRKGRAESPMVEVMVEGGATKGAEGGSINLAKREDAHKAVETSRQEQETLRAWTAERKEIFRNEMARFGVHDEQIKMVLDSPNLNFDEAADVRGTLSNLAPQQHLGESATSDQPGKAEKKDEGVLKSNDKCWRTLQGWWSKKNVAENPSERSIKLWLSKHNLFTDGTLEYDTWMIDLDTAWRLEFWPSREWLARKLSNPKRDRDLWDCAAKMKSSWKTTVFSFINERCSPFGAVFHRRLYHIELLQRLSRTHLPGNSQNDPLVLLIFCAKSSSDDTKSSSNDTAPRGMFMRRAEGHGRFHAMSSPSRDRPRDPRIITIGADRRERARRRSRPRIESDDSSSLPVVGRSSPYFVGRPRMGNRRNERERGRHENFAHGGGHGGHPRHGEQVDEIEILDTDSKDGRSPRRIGGGHGQRLPRVFRPRPRSRSRAHRSHSQPRNPSRIGARRTPSRHRRYYYTGDSDTESEYEHSRIIRPRSSGDYSSDDSFQHYNSDSETKQSDAEIIDQILREYTTFGDGNAIPTAESSAPLSTTTNNEPVPTSSPIEQASMNGRANAADGTSDAS